MDDDALWGPPMPFWEAIEWSGLGPYAGLFWAGDTPGTVLNVGIDPETGEPAAVNADHFLTPQIDKLVAERTNWRAFRPIDAISRLGKLADAKIDPLGLSTAGDIALLPTICRVEQDQEEP